MEQEARPFEARMLEMNEVHELPDSWPLERLRALLSTLDVEDVSDDEAMEMTVMALQELDVDDASDLVLASVFGDDMRPGVRQNLVPDLREDRPWEEFAEISQQRGIFESVVLLQRAYPRDFGKPDAVSLSLEVETGSNSARAWLDTAVPDPGLLLRILASGMDEHAVLKRLFEEPLAADRFPEAGAIIWYARRRESPAPGFVFEIVSSHQWFDALEDAERFSARAWPDLPSS